MPDGPAALHEDPTLGHDEVACDSRNVPVRLRSVPKAQFALRPTTESDVVAYPELLGFDPVGGRVRDNRRNPLLAAASHQDKD